MTDESMIRFPDSHVIPARRHARALTARASQEKLDPETGDGSPLKPRGQYMGLLSLQ